jgi:hypothetical protein
MVESGIPSIVIEKMKVKNNDNILLTIDLVEGICSSPFYNSEKNRLKVYSILNILLSVLENTNKTEDICRTINGALGGMEFGENRTKTLINKKRTFCFSFFIIHKVIYHQLRNLDPLSLGHIQS